MTGKFLAYARSLIMIFAAPIFLLSVGLLLSANSQGVSSFERERGRVMLDMVKTEIKKNYYDPGFHGVDLEARFKAADEKIRSAASLGQVFGIIAQAMTDLGDSHTFFIPPSRAYRTEYGWQMQMIGDVCYVVAVKPGSDAATKGLKVGDVVHSIDGHPPARENLWKLQYLYYTLRPQPGMRVVAQGPDAEPREIDVMAKVEQGRRNINLTDANEIMTLVREAETESRLHRHRYHEVGDELIVWKMPEFDLPPLKVDDVMNNIRKRKSLILDLRGNSGGDEDMLLRLIGSLFDHDIKLGEIKRRKETKALIAKSRGDQAFNGKLVVLIDSKSASASEVLARVVQLEKRGLVIGDLSAGAVMRAKIYPHQVGADIVVPYAACITDADLIMTDGKSLERIGVTPNELLLPTAADLAAKRDPVLSRAAALAGVKIDPEKAGSLFPIEWGK